MIISQATYFGELFGVLPLLIYISVSLINAGLLMYSSSKFMLALQQCGYKGKEMVAIAEPNQVLWELSGIGFAEAEAIEKKAEAMKKYGQAAMLEMIIGILPEMAKNIAEPFASIDNISIIDSGNGEGGVNSMGAYVPGTLAKVLQSVKEVTGLDLVEVMKAETYDAKVNRNINISGLEGPVDTEKVAEIIKNADESDLPLHNM